MDVGYKGSGGSPSPYNVAPKCLLLRDSRLVVTPRWRLPLLLPKKSSPFRGLVTPPPPLAVPLPLAGEARWRSYRRGGDGGSKPPPYGPPVIVRGWENGTSRAPSPTVCVKARANWTLRRIPILSGEA